jgi:hypothetical protein
MCDDCATLLSEGLDLCERARKLDAQGRTNTAVAVSSAPKEWWAENMPKRAAMHNQMFPDQPMLTRSATIPLWVQDQYDKDLADWERRGRAHLQKSHSF